MRPLAIDLFCGLGGWSEGLLAAGYDVIGFDNERHEYGEHKYPAQLVLQDVLTLRGSQFAGADLIVASPPCQEFSYMAMPWTRGKQIARALRNCGEFPANYTGSRTVAELTALFDACFRIQREACEAAGRHVPLVVENVNGAQTWVGPARWHFGSFYLWGDVPALMPVAHKRIGDGMKVGDRNQHRASGGHQWSTHWTEGTKNSGGSWFNIAHNTTSGKGRNPDGRNDPRDSMFKVPGNAFSDKGFNVAAAERYGHMVEGCDYKRTVADKRSHVGAKRKFASALIAKIPFDLARWIGQSWLPRGIAA